jgi:hypothetical protein
MKRLWNISGFWLTVNPKFMDTSLQHWWFSDLRVPLKWSLSRNRLFLLSRSSSLTNAHSSTQQNKRFDMVMELTNAYNRLRVRCDILYYIILYYIIHTVWLLHISAAHMAILSEVHGKGYITKRFELMHKYKILVSYTLIFYICVLVQNFCNTFFTMHLHETGHKCPETCRKHSVYKIPLNVFMSVFVSLPYSISLMHGHKLLKILKASGQPQYFVLRGSISHLYLFLETGYPGRVITWNFFHLLSTSRYRSRSNHSGHACCYTIMNHLDYHLLCASSRYWYSCFRHQRICIVVPYSYAPFFVSFLLS